MSPWKTWVVGEEVLAADFNDYLQEQVVATFTNSAARSAAISSPAAGQITYLTATNALEVYDGAAWSRPKNVAWGWVSGPAYATPMTNVVPGAQFVTGLGFSLPFAGRRYVIHASLTVYQHDYTGTTQLVTAGVQPDAAVGAFAETQQNSGGGTGFGDTYAFSFNVPTLATTNNQVGAIVINPAVIQCDVKSGMVWIEDIGT